MTDLRDCPTAEYHKIHISSISRGKNSVEISNVSHKLIHAICLRSSYINESTAQIRENNDFLDKIRNKPFDFHEPPFTDESSFRFDCGIFITGDDILPKSYSEFARDLHWLYFEFCSSKEARTFAHKRLQFLELNYNLHKELNQELEHADIIDDLADFNSVMKVDNHVHAASIMTQRELLSFIRLKSISEGGTSVVQNGDSLNTVLKENGISDPLTASTEKLQVSASPKMFHRFDHFNDAYNPFKKATLRCVFMKTSNFIQGRYFGEILRDVVFPRMRNSGSVQAMEPRFSIYGFGEEEWLELARFFCMHKVLDCHQGCDAVYNNPRVKWMVTAPYLQSSR